MKRILLTGIIISTIAITGCYYYGPCLDGSGPVISETRIIEGFTGVKNTGSFDVYVTRSETFNVEVVAQENLIPIIETYVSGHNLIIEIKNGSCYRSSSPVEIHVSLPEMEELVLSGSGDVFADVAESSVFECSNSGSGHIEIDTIHSGSTSLINSGSGTIDALELNAVEVSLIQTGSGIIEGGTVIGSSDVSIHHSSSGKVRASIVDGTKVDATLSGSGRIDLDGFAPVASYVLSSSGKIDALELETMDADATITGSGNIFLWATDHLEATITGSGDIIYRGTPNITLRITGSGKVRSY